jgi:hypothetical protein
MKTKTLFSLIILISAGGSIAAQNPTTQERPRRALSTEATPQVAEAVLKEVTLYWYHMSDRPFPAQPDDSRSSVNLETGERGPARGGSFDLRYGGVIIGAPGHPSVFLADWLGGLDCRSMIVDLGAKTWQDFKATPPLPSPQYLTESQALAPCTVVVDASAGVREISPYRQMVVPKPGHIYFMRLVNGSKLSYLLFRVESLNSKESCVISWKPVTPPNARK